MATYLIQSLKVPMIYCMEDKKNIAEKRSETREITENNQNKFIDRRTFQFQSVLSYFKMLERTSRGVKFEEKAEVGAKKATKCKNNKMTKLTSTGIPRNNAERAREIQENIKKREDAMLKNSMELYKLILNMELPKFGDETG